MNPVSAKFDELKRLGKKALIPYIMGGDPDLGSTPRQLEILAENGADLIEVGVPFSDPLADGSVIQAAGLRSLQNGCTFEKLLATLKPIVPRLHIPVMLMVYYNMLYRRGLNRFFEEIREAGCAGLIIPDLPVDEAMEVRELAAQFAIGLNFLVAPTSADARIQQAAEASTGFLYAVSLKGITGARVSLPPELPDFIARVKRFSSKPVAVGFGISTPEQARLVGSMADGVIVGSAVVQAAAADSSYQTLQQYIRDLRNAL